MTITNPKYTILKTVHDSVSTIELWDNGIIFIKIKDNVYVELEDSKRQLEIFRSFYNGIDKMKVLVEAGKDTNISKEAREFSALPSSNEMTFANAVVVGSLAQRLLINFLINYIKKQPVKMRIFDNKQKALEWLLAL